MHQAAAFAPVLATGPPAAGVMPPAAASGPVLKIGALTAVPRAAASAPVLNIGALTSLLVSVVVVCVLFAAVAVLLRAHRRDTGAVVGVVAVVLIGALIAGLASGHNVVTLGGDLFHLIFRI